MGRVLITGSNGLLGTKLIELLLRTGRHKPLGASRAERSNGFLGEIDFWRLDVTDAAAVELVLAESRPDAVIHTAAMTDVDGCERDRDAAHAVNAIGAANLATACARRRVRLVQLSTEYVFDGAAGPYREDGATNPLGWYAKTKLEGEQSVLRIHPGAAVARTTVIYGYAPNVRANFVLWLTRSLRGHERVRIVSDQVGSPTLADNLAEMVLALAESDASGVYNTVGADVMSRYQFARLAARIFALDEALIDPTTTAALGQPAPRPLRAGLLMDKFSRIFPHVAVRSAGEGLALLRGQLVRAGLA